MVKIRYSGLISYLIWFFYKQSLYKDAIIKKKGSDLFLETDKYRGKIKKIDNIYLSFFYRYFVGFCLILATFTFTSNSINMFFTYLFSAIIGWFLHKGLDKKKAFFISSLVLLLILIHIFFRDFINIVNISHILSYMPNTVIAFFIFFRFFEDIKNKTYKNIFIIKDKNIVFSIEK